MTPQPQQALAAARPIIEKVLRHRARGGDGWGFNADMHEEAVTNAILAALSGYTLVSDAELERLRAALRIIADGTSYDPEGAIGVRPRNIARAALAPESSNAK